MVEFTDPYIGTVRVTESVVGDLYQMACDYTRQRGNTLHFMRPFSRSAMLKRVWHCSRLIKWFHFLKRQIEERYPELKEKYKE